MTLSGVLLATERGVYAVLPGEPPQRLSQELDVTALDYRDGVALATVPGQGVWRATGERDWTQVWEGDARIARIGPGGTFYVGAAPAALHVSEDGGRTWEHSQQLDSVLRYQRSRSTGQGGSAAWHVSAIAFPGGALLVGVRGAGVWFSADGGRSWMPRLDGLDLQVAGIVEHPERDDRLYALTVSGLYRSDDGGYTWLQSITGLDRANATGVAVLPGAPDALLLAATRRPTGEFGALFRSIDGGVRWLRFLLGDDDEWPTAPLVTALAGSLDTAFVYAGGRVWASHDRGGDWRALTERMELPPARAMVVAL